MFKPASIAQQTTTPLRKVIDEPIAEPTKKAKASSKALSKKTVCRGRGQQRKVKRSAASTDKLQSKSSLLNTSILSQLNLTNFNVEELETMVDSFEGDDLMRIRINKRIMSGLQLALADKRYSYEISNTLGLLFLQLFRPDILEAIQKMSFDEDSKKK